VNVKGKTVKHIVVNGAFNPAVSGMPEHETPVKKRPREPRTRIRPELRGGI
jgi:hypothetical protein